MGESYEENLYLSGDNDLPDCLKNSCESYFPNQLQNKVPAITCPALCSAIAALKGGL